MSEPTKEETHNAVAYIKRKMWEQNAISEKMRDKERQAALDAKNGRNLLGNRHERRKAAKLNGEQK
jgi:hypothetical protein